MFGKIVTVKIMQKDIISYFFCYNSLINKIMKSVAFLNSWFCKCNGKVINFFVSRIFFERVSL